MPNTEYTTALIIEQKRKEKGLSQKQLAEKVGITPASISGYEKGIKTPSLDIAVRIAEFFGISMDVLCGYVPQNANQIRTVSDLIRWFHLVIDTGLQIKIDKHERIDEELFIGDTYTVSCICVGEYRFEGFLEEWTKIRDLYLNGTIDKDLYDAWIEKQLRIHENNLIHTQQEGDTNNGEHQTENK